MQIIDEIFGRPELIAKPPVLIDVGASGSVHPEWRRFSRYAICIAFDADDREMGFLTQESGNFRTLYLHHCMVAEEPNDPSRFFLTRSPYCSSALRPNTERLAAWAFYDLFAVEREVSIRSQTLSQVLAEHGLAYVDYFKTDSQGTDLRLFKSLGSDIVARVLAADFEPGIIDAYDGEDKLHALMAFMDHNPFWMHSMRVEGSQRLPQRARERLSQEERERTRFVVPVAPGWAEVGYLNTLDKEGSFDARDLLLAWVFATLKGQHGFALEIALGGLRRYPRDHMFSEMERSSLDRFSRRNIGAARAAIGRSRIARLARKLLKP